MKSKYYFVSYQPMFCLNNAIFNTTVKIEGALNEETVKKALEDIGVTSANVISWSAIEEEEPISRVEKLKAAAEAAGKDKASATKFLQGAGIIDEEGNLKEPYK